MEVEVGLMLASSFHGMIETFQMTFGTNALARKGARWYHQDENNMTRRLLCFIMTGRIC